MVPADADVVAAPDLPAVGDRRLADGVDPEPRLELVLEPEHLQVLGLDVSARVVAPLAEQPQAAHQRRLRRLRPAERGREVDASAGVGVDPLDAPQFDLLSH